MVNRRKEDEDEERVVIQRKRKQGGNKNGEGKIGNLEDRNRDTKDQWTKKMGKEMGKDREDTGGGTVDTKI